MNCLVLETRKLVDGFFYLSLKPDHPLEQIVAGQFVMVQVGHSTAPLLRRPMGIADYESDGSRFGLVIQIIGKGTRLLSRLVSGDGVDVLGPFGNGFPTDDLADKNIWAVAGGTGVAPFMGLAGNGNSFNDFSLLLGARSADLVLQKSYFKSCGVSVYVSTEDGSDGFKGLVTELFEERIKSDGKPDVILTCGPAAMMSALANTALKHDIPLYASLENRMACGFGACLGCVTKKRDEDKYITVCRKGPVFLSSEVEI